MPPIATPVQSEGALPHDSPSSKPILQTNGHGHLANSTATDHHVPNGVEIDAVRINAPKITPLPITLESKHCCLEPYHVDLLPLYGYTERENLISGTSCGEPFCTRLLLRCPQDPAAFSGLVVCETSHIWAGTSVWRATNRWLMRNGHAWLEIDSQAPVAMGVVRASDPQRYAAMTFPSSPLSKDFQETIPYTPDPTRQKLEDEYSAFMLRWWAATPQSNDILASASYALRSGQMGLNASTVFLSGISQTGGVTRRFLTHAAHLRLPDGSVPFEALLPCASGGAALPDPPEGVKVIELLGESEFQSVRWACGVSGQTRALTHRRPDSPGFRLYEVAGMGHRELRYASALDWDRFGGYDLGGAVWSTYPSSFVYHAVYEMALKWVKDSTYVPPASKMLEIVPGSTDEVARDEHGNAIGGWRSLYTDVPTSRIVAATPKGRPYWYAGTEWRFTSQQLKELYGSKGAYWAKAGEAISQQVKEGALLPCDAELLRMETVETLDF